MLRRIRHCLQRRHVRCVEPGRVRFGVLLWSYRPSRKATFAQPERSFSKCATSGRSSSCRQTCPGRRLFHDRLPGLVDDGGCGFEQPVRKPTVAHELPDVLGRAAQQVNTRPVLDGDAGGSDEPVARMPAGLVHQQHDEDAWRQGTLCLETPEASCRVRPGGG